MKHIIFIAYTSFYSFKFRRKFSITTSIDINTFFIYITNYHISIIMRQRSNTKRAKRFI